MAQRYSLQGCLFAVFICLEKDPVILLQISFPHAKCLLTRISRKCSCPAESDSSAIAGSQDQCNLAVVS